MKTRLLSFFLFAGALILVGMGWLSFGYRLPIGQDPLAILLTVVILSATAGLVSLVRSLGRRHGHARLALVASVGLVCAVFWVLPMVVAPCSPTIAVIRASGLESLSGKVKCDQCCIDADPYPCPLCSAADYAAGKCIGCCYAYAPCNCREEDTPVPPTRTRTPTPSRTPTKTRTRTPTRTVTMTATSTATLTRTFTPTQSPTQSRTVMPSSTPTMLPTQTSTGTSTPAIIATAAFTATMTPSSTATATQPPPPTNTPVPLPPSVISGISCEQWGSNGWCIRAARLHLDVVEPQGLPFSVTGRAGDLPISCSASCVVDLPEGQGDVMFSVTSFSGLVVSGSQPWKLDTSLPSAALQFQGTLGANGWYTSQVQVSATGQDVISGVDSLQVRFPGDDWQPEMTLSDGTYQAQARAVDEAGWQALSDVQIVQVDTVAPDLRMVPSGVKGDGGYFRSAVTVSLAASDGGSGVGRVEYRLDGQDWVNGNTVVIATDGDHGLEGRVTDWAGNSTYQMLVVHIDKIPPVATFITHQSGVTTLARGMEMLAGNVSDVGSGVARVEISLDKGKTWQALRLVNEIWRYDWDTTQLPNGSYPVIVRARDVAGNVQAPGINVTVLAANHPPQVDVQERWNIWEQGAVSVRDNGGVPVDGVRVTIRDPLGRWPELVQEYSLRNLPGSIVWNRRFGDGTLAPSGEYDVVVEAWDEYGNDASDQGVIIIPFIAGATETAIPSVTPSPTPIVTNTVAPTKVITPTQIVMPTVAPTIQPTLEPVVEQPGKSLSFWPAVGLLGLMLVLASAAISDGRPRALARMKETFNQIMKNQGE